MSLPEPIARSHSILRFARKMQGRSSPDLETIAEAVLAAFQEVGSEWCVIGGHARNLYAEPRATQDIDFIVDARTFARAVDAVRGRLGDLDEVDIGAALRLRAVSVDLVRGAPGSLFREALDRATTVGTWRVPPVEVLIVLKFLAATSHWRARERKLQDVTDIVVLYEASRDRLDRDLVASLAARVYPGAERELGEMLERIDTGRPIEV